jgi:radical SAM family RiPP maturation amino acid epimerase
VSAQLNPSPLGLANDAEPVADAATLPHIKRFVEVVNGDPDFRQAALETPGARQRLLDEAGIHLSSEDLAPFWQILERGPESARNQAELVGLLAAYPLGRLWIQHRQEMEAKQKESLRDWAPTGHPRITAWRRRNIARVHSESLHGNTQQVFPLFAFELSKGCSPQCWFCGFHPPKFQGYFAYTDDNRRLWRELLQSAWDLFGVGCKTAATYHATDPTDNPDYFRFIEDYIEIFGTCPQTTTAMPLKDVAWTRQMLRLREQDNDDCPDRFSILSTRIFRQVLKAFTAEELKDVKMAFRNTGSLNSLAHCGRAVEHPRRLKHADERVATPEGSAEMGVVPSLTIECTCGYLVNLVERSIKLISPCNASERWPLGYRVHAEGSFQDAAEFRAFIERSMAEAMPERLEAEAPLAFRPDLAYEAQPDGFVLTSRFNRHAVQGSPHLARLGELVHQGGLTSKQATDALVDAGMPIFHAINWLERLYQRGFLDDGLC